MRSPASPTLPGWIAGYARLPDGHPWVGSPDHAIPVIGQYLARRSPITSGWEVFDLATQTSREDGFDQAAAEQLAAELNVNNRIYPEPHTVRVLVGDRWRFGTATVWRRRDGRTESSD